MIIWPLEYDRLGFLEAFDEALGDYYADCFHQISFACKSSDSFEKLEQIWERELWSLKVMLPLSQYFSSKQSFWYTFPASPLPSEQRSTEFILLLYMALFPLSFLLLYSSSIGPTDYLTSPASDVFEENSFLVLTPLTTCSSEPFLACLIVFNTYLLKLFSFFPFFFSIFLTWTELQSESQNSYI